MNKSKYSISALYNSLASTFFIFFEMKLIISIIFLTINQAFSTTFINDRMRIFNPTIHNKIQNGEKLDVDEYGQNDVFSGIQGVINDNTFSAMPEIEDISIIDCEIRKVDVNTFKGLKNLHSIQISSNSKFPRITNALLTSVTNLRKFTAGNVANQGELDIDALSNLPKLEHVSIFYQHSKRITKKMFEGSVKITDIIWGSSDLELIEDDTFAGLPELQYLDFSNNKIQKIFPNTFDNSKIVTISLNFNELKIVRGDEIGNLSALTDFALAYNQITSIDSTKLLRKAPNLKNLNLENNKLDCDQQTKLKSIDIVVAYDRKCGK